VTLFKPQPLSSFKRMALLDTLLAIEPSARGTVASALDSEDQAAGV
jgi:hypothetical protein